MARRGRRLLRAVPITLSLGLSGLSVWVTSSSAFSVPEGELTAAGQTVLQVDGQTTAAFDVGGLAPGAFGERCLVVSAGQPERGPVLLYLTEVAPASTLAAHLRITVEVGRGGSFGSCRGFGGDVVARGSLAALAAAHHSLRTGLGAWTPLASASGATSSRTYRITYTLDPSAPNSVAGTAVETTFVWDRPPVA